MDKIYFEMPDGTRRDIEELHTEIKEQVKRKTQNERRDDTENSGEVSELDTPRDDINRKG